LVRAGTWVFVVEDETIQAMELDDMLARLGCRVAGNAASLRDALDKARRLEFDLAIVDLKLGSHSGEAVVDEVARRRIPPDHHQRL
jgi:ActR/RegA family two-component response regulator